MPFNFNAIPAIDLFSMKSSKKKSNSIVIWSAMSLYGEEFQLKENEKIHFKSRENSLEKYDEIAISFAPREFGI